MKNQFFVGVAFATLAAASHAAGNSDLNVTGKLMPPACNAHFGGNATLDFDVIAFNALDNNGTNLGSKDTALQINCGGPTRVSVVALDNRAGSGITIQEAPNLNWPYQNPENGSKYSWGLGFADGQKIKTGALIGLITPATTTVDGVLLTTAGAQKVLARPTGSNSWTVASSHYSLNLSPDLEYSFGPIGGPAVPITNAQLTMGLTPMIGQPATLPSANEIPLDGSITFTLRYL
ncbi:DUF1120 domain-containing protein [Achromobacter sp. JUb104]|uniref:DUF1120 domain-containing protein n=1 Tax=Achromobacter sp. JUb104 TaxID=2940590 RepID=UPI0021682B8E|nr:DUF1120 domain-containing protein [Achromobacter sp. JUb104]MCS3509798.1 type 1 fimbria pilin [Achromobacter sp. JUb104]